MHKLFVPALAAAALFALAACGPSNQTPSTAATHASQAATATAITGTVNLRLPAQLGPGATLDLELINVTLKPSLIAAQTKGIAVSGLPANFRLDFDPVKIDPAAFYVLDARLTDGERRYVSARQYPVLTKGAPVKVDLQLNPEPTAAEKVEEEYRMLERAIGGMKRAQGSSEDENSTTAWDGFFDKSGLRYIREVTDLGDKGRVNTYFAYREGGKPMLVLRENVPAMSERANATARAGWNDQGELVVKIRRDGSSSGELAVNDATVMYNRATALFELVSKRQPK